MTVADIVKDYSRSILLKVEESGYGELVKLFKSLKSKGMKDVLSEGISKKRIKIENSVDMRYMGQSHELNLPFKKSFIDDFHKRHKRSYGYANWDYSIEVVNIRVRVTGKTRKPVMEKRPKVSSEKKQTIGKKTKCFFRGKWLKADVIDRNRVQKRSRINGPVLIVEDTSTTFLTPEYICNIDNYDNLIIEQRI
jgi:N-methylhydantoinase A